MALAAFGNTYIQTSAPWKLIKTDRAAAAQVIKNSIQIAKALALLIEPVMPAKAQECWAQLGYDDMVAAHRIDEATGPVPELALKAPAPLFSRLDEKQIAELDAVLQQRVREANKKMEKTPMISIEDFSKVEMKTGKILAAEAIPKSSKLLKLQVDVGGETRQIVSGIAQFYKPEELTGKDVVVLTNLAPAKIFGVESNGMILAAGDAAALLTPEKPVEPGTKIR
jgi:methionyl-tRNA synthetase